jgi:MFS family permease
VGFIIVHLGTMISLEDFKKQWKTFLIGVSTVLGIGVALYVASLIFGGSISGASQDGYAQARDFVIAGTGALSGGTISVVLVQEAALGVGLTSVAIFPVLIAALQGLIGFPLTSIILKREAARLKVEYREGNLTPAETLEAEATAQSRLPAALTTTAGTLFVVGIAVLVGIGINNLTNDVLNTFVVALILGITLRTFGIFKPSVLGGIDALGLMMIAIMILIFGPLATVEPSDVSALAGPLVIAFAFGVLGIGLFSGLVGKLLGASIPMSVAADHPDPGPADGTGRAGRAGHADLHRRVRRHRPVRRPRRADRRPTASPTRHRRLRAPDAGRDAARRPRLGRLPGTEPGPNGRHRRGALGRSPVPGRGFRPAESGVSRHPRRAVPGRTTRPGRSC